MLRVLRRGPTACGVLLMLVILAAPFVIDAQSTTRPARVGIIGLTPNVPANIEMFKQGLAERGYIVGQHVVVDNQHADNVPARLPETAARMVATKPDIIFTRGPDSIVATLRATTSIPIVAVDFESDPLAKGFAKSLARPGGNVTGIFMDQPEMSAKQLQLLRDIIRGLTRVALLGDLTGNATQFRATERAAQTFGVQTQALEIRAPEDLEPALETARRHGVGAVIVFSSPLVFGNSARLAALTNDKRLPTVSLFAAFPQAGGLMSYGPSIGDAFRRCGIHVAKILGGQKPAEIPIDRPERFELVINLKTAKVLGLKMPPSLLARAEQLIE